MEEEAEGAWMRDTLSDDERALVRQAFDWLVVYRLLCRGEGAAASARAPGPQPVGTRYEVWATLTLIYMLNGFSRTLFPMQQTCEAVRTAPDFMLRVNAQMGRLEQQPRAAAASSDMEEEAEAEGGWMRDTLRDDERALVRQAFEWLGVYRLLSSGGGEGAAAMAGAPGPQPVGTRYEVWATLTLIYILNGFSRTLFPMQQTCEAVRTAPDFMLRVNALLGRLEQPGFSAANEQQQPR